jgi:hypothetical protein
MDSPYKFDFASPSKYGDWAQYAGFNRTTGEIPDSPFATPQAGVPPPQSMGDVFKQAIAPSMQKYENLSNAMSQVGQGNVVQAYNAYKAPPPAQTQQPVQDVGNSDYQYHTQIGY